MSNKSDNRLMTVDGFVFENKQDYEDAVREKKGIKYLNRQLDLNDPDRTLKLYNEIIEKKIFRTPVGIEYMNRLRTTLVQGGMTAVPYIPVPDETSDASRTIKDSREYRKLDGLYKKKCERLRTSLILNIILAIMIAAMFIISARSGNPTILKYREKIEDRYSQWDTELKEKEKELRERERAIEQREHNEEITEQNGDSQN